MPIEDFEEEGLKKIPNLELAQKFFTLQSKHSSSKEKEDAKAILEQHIQEQSKFNYLPITTTQNLHNEPSVLVR